MADIVSIKAMSTLCERLCDYDLYGDYRDKRDSCEVEKSIERLTALFAQTLKLA